MFGVSWVESQRTKQRAASVAHPLPLPGHILQTMNPNTWSVNELVIVTRGGCANTPVMQANLETALRTLGLPVGFHLVDLDLLAGTDVLTGYPTPTLLFRGRDVFGMPKPKPPFPEPA